MAKLFKRAVHEPIRRLTDYEDPQAHNDPAVVNQPAVVAERVHLFVDHVLQQAMVDDTWSFGPLTGHLLESWLLPHPKWQDEHQSYTRKTKDTICKAVMQALSDYQDHLTGADRDEDSITKVAVQAPWEPPAYEGYTAKYTKKPLYDKAVKRLKALQFPLTLYRAVKIPSEADLWQNHVGIFWTDKLENARFYTPAGRTAPGEKFVLRTEVQPHMIDWDSTFNANTESHGNTGTREQEIKLHMGAPVVINGILPPGGTEFEPRQIRIQAKTADDKTKKKRDWRGLKINIEHPAGTTRSGTDAQGNRWEREMLFDYGHFRGVEGADGDGLDCYVGPDPDSDVAYVVNQLFEDGSFDEHKVMLGFRDQGTATAAYLAHMPPGWSRFDPVRPMTVQELRHWLLLEDKEGKVAAQKIAAPAFQSFESWVKALGGWKGLVRAYGKDWLEHYYEMAGENCGDMRPGKAHDKCVETSVEEMVMQDLRGEYDNWHYHYDSHLQFPLKVFRAVSLSNPDGLKTEGIGIYWTWSESHAQAHWGHGNGKVYVLSAEIDEDAVDWPGTIYANMAPSTGADEQEIRLKEGAVIRLTGFKLKNFGFGQAEPWKPLNAEAVA